MKHRVTREDKLKRLRFLQRVVEKEIHHIRYSANKLSNKPFSVDQAKRLDHDEELAEQVEAFASRFCRLQDTVGDKLILAWLDVLEEKIPVAIDNLNKAEKWRTPFC